MANILIFGAGAVGQFMGFLMTRANKHKVTMVGRYDHYDVIKIKGLDIKRHGKDEYVKAFNFLPSSDRIPAGASFDWIFLTVKAYELTKALKEISYLISSKTKILLFQMGVGSHEVVTKIIPEDRLFLATLTANVAIIQQGTLVETNKEGAICIAPVMLRNSLSELSEVLSGIALDVKTFDDWKPMKWSALLYEMLLNGQCGLVDYTPEKVMSSGPLFEIELEAFIEAMNVVKAIGVEPMDLPAYPIKKLMFYAKFPGFLQLPMFKGLLIKKDSVKVPTIKNDMDKGRKGTEIGFINGAIGRWGKERGIRTPVNDFLTDELVKIVIGKRLWDVYRKKPEEEIDCLHFYKLNYVR
jgi:2-dehydropantoate 2-reductase